MTHDEKGLTIGLALGALGMLLFAASFMLAGCQSAVPPRVSPQCQLLFQERAKIYVLHKDDHYRDFQNTPYKELVRETIILDRASWCDDHPTEDVF